MSRGQPGAENGVSVAFGNRLPHGCVRDALQFHLEALRSQYLGRYVADGCRPGPLDVGDRDGLFLYLGLAFGCFLRAASGKQQGSGGRDGKNDEESSFFHVRNPPWGLSPNYPAWTPCGIASMY